VGCATRCSVKNFGRRASERWSQGTSGNVKSCCQEATLPPSSIITQATSIFEFSPDEFSVSSCECLMVTNKRNVTNHQLRTIERVTARMLEAQQADE
jgi:hypothetical protein